MEEVFKIVAKSLLIQQSVNVGSKLINNRRITKNEEKGFWLSLLFFGLMNLPTQQPAYNEAERN